MPLYEYRCKQCGHQFEKIQSFSAPDEKECPACKGELERLISAPAIQFKGSGWYVTDYARKGGSKSASSSESGKESSGDSKPAASSTEAKPAASTSSAALTSSSTKKSE
ncbi:MAG TPA: zinc ribbon domain-containing protein [Acidobacteriaceae bacterium]|nr:zinc ribbon domain-containing protein [Acidobacteriaceae bacterium]